MTTAHRRPRLLHLVLPHPALDQASPSTPVASPHTPRRPPKPETGHTRSSMASDRPPRSSIDSWNSVDTNELAWEWKDQELELLSKTLDNIPSHLMTPFVGAVPPPNVLDKLARNIALSRTALEWPHSVRATRVKLHELSRRKTVQKAIERHAPVMRTEVEPRRPLYRQSSMDFLPVKNEATSVTRLSSRLQRTDRTAHASFHPYARPSSRSPTPPLETLSRSITPEPRAPSPRKLFRSSATPPPQTLKRTPSYSATKSRAPESPSYSSDEEEKARQATAKRPRTTRRVPSFLGAPLPALAPSPEEEILDPLVGGPEDLVFAPTIPPVKRKSLPPPPRARPAPRPSVPTPRPSVPTPRSSAPTPRSSAPTRPSASTARPSAPVVRPSVPAARPTAPPTPAPAPAPTTPRTLRRIGTRNFPPPASVAALARAMAPAPAVEPQPRRVSAPRPLAPPRRVSSTAQTSEPRRERKREDKDSKPKPKKSPEHLASMRL